MDVEEGRRILADCDTEYPADFGNPFQVPRGEHNENYGCLPMSSYHVEDNLGVVVIVGAESGAAIMGTCGEETGAARRFRFLADAVEMSNCAQPPLPNCFYH